jgi:prevent-host-death family protein
MRSVGVKELKARLSEYLRQVKRGETLLVTDRNEVVAELRPPRQSLVARDEMAELLESLAELGEVTMPGRSKTGWVWQPKGLGLPAGTAARLLDDLREDR